jgi:peptide/nickel transport system substrate-binding protein
MKQMTKSLLFVLLLVLIGVFVTAAAAQEMPGPGEGGPIIISNLGSDIASLNPIVIQDGSSNTIANRIYPDLIGVDIETFNYAPGAPGSIATAWELSEDGLTYTFTLRDDWAWSDGTPITSADVKYAFDAIASGETTSALTYVLDDVASVEAPDPQTVVMTLNAPSCAALNNIAAIPVVPSHEYSTIFPAFADMNEAELTAVGDVTAGTWTFGNLRPGEQVTLLADQAYPDAIDGQVTPEGFIFKNVADQTISFEQFLAGQLTWDGAPEGRENEIRALAADGYQVHEYPAGSLRFISLNAADPANPQNGLDDNGDPIEQGHHPIFGDVRVRQALMYALDFAQLNEGALGGEGVPLASHILPSSWAFDPELPVYPFDLEMAGQLLDEAGFVDDDNDPATPRVANEDALYAEPGTPLAFTLATNSGNEASESIGVLLTSIWAEAGFDMTYEAIDFNVLVERLTGQTYDAVMLFWGFGFPDDPNGAKVTFDPANDVVGAGFNVTSYNNPEWMALMDEANTVPGCDQAARVELYQEAFAILREDVPWIWLNTSNVVIAAQPGVVNWDPRGQLASWNESSWIIPR